MVGSCAQSEKPLRVMSFNIRNSGMASDSGDCKWMNRRDAVVKMINEEQPAVIGMQEALPDQLAFLSETLAQYDYIGVGRDDGDKEGEVMAIFYRNDQLEVKESGTFWLSETPDEVSLGWDGACRRTCTWAVMQAKQGGNKFLFLNTHLDHVGDTARTEAIKLIVKKFDMLAKEGMPVFLTADFNSDTDEERFGVLKAARNDARKDCDPTDNGPTFNEWGKALERNVRIDHIFYKNAKPASFKVIRDNKYGVEYISDHFPVVFDCILCN